MRTKKMWLLPLLAIAFAAGGADTPTEPAKKTEPVVKAKKKKPMKMNEPIANEMKKEGMTKGEVKKMEAQKESQLKPMLQQEEKSMPTK